MSKPKFVQITATQGTGAIYLFGLTADGTVYSWNTARKEWTLV